MSKEAAVKPAANEAKNPAAATPAAPAKPITTAAAVEKASAKPARKAPAAAPEKPAEAPKAEKPAKVKKQTPKKVKLIRDSFSIPETDYVLFATLKQRALAAGIDVKKSEVLRAALATLAKLDDAALVAAIGLVERIKTGRPKK